MAVFSTFNFVTKRLQSFVRGPREQKTVGYYCELFRKACDTSPEEGSKALIQMIDAIHKKRPKLSLGEAYNRAIKLLTFIEFKTVNKKPDDFPPAARDAIKRTRDLLLH